MIVTGSKSWLWGLIAAVAVVQTAALAKIVVDRQSLLTTGREIIVKTEPVDPRDLVRGDYVVLGYGLNPIDSAKINDPTAFAGIARGSVVYVTVAEQPGHVWRPVRVTASYPEAVGANEAVLKGIVEQRWTTPADPPATAPLPPEQRGTTLNLRYGIESYFVPEGTGRKLEQMVRDQTVEAVIAVGLDGTAAIKGLILNGERHVDPPLY